MYIVSSKSTQFPHCVIMVVFLQLEFFQRFSIVSKKHYNVETEPFATLDAYFRWPWNFANKTTSISESTNTKLIKFRLKSCFEMNLLLIIVKIWIKMGVVFDKMIAAPWSRNYKGCKIVFHIWNEVLIKQQLSKMKF